MSFLSYAHVSRCARHALEPTDHRLLYADDIMICAVSHHSVVAIRSAWFNAPWFFLWGQQQQWIGRGVRVARPCWPIVAATISNMQWGTGPTVWTRIVKHAFFNKMISVQLSVFNSDPYGRTASLRISHKRHVCEYMFLHKKDPLCMAYHPYHFVGEVLLHPVYIPDLWSGQKPWHDCYLTPMVKFGEVRRAHLAKSTLLTSTWCLWDVFSSFKIC